MAICNASSAFLDAAANSKNGPTKELALNPETWMTVFNIFLARYEDAKPKALKLLLGSLATTLAKHLAGENKSTIQQNIAEATLPSIILGEPRSRLKGSLVCLEWMIRKGAIIPSQFISLVQNWLSKNREQWIPIFKKDSNGIFGDCSEVIPELLSGELAANIFILGLLTQSNNRELSATAGNLLSTFLQRLKSECPAMKLSDIWVAPIKHIILQNMDQIEVLSNQLLEPLFAIDPAGFRSFVDSLPFESFMTGDMSNAKESEFILLFSALQMGKKSNLVLDDCKCLHTLTKDTFANFHS